MNPRMQPPAPTDVVDVMPEVDAAIERAVDWLLHLQRPDGALGDPRDGFNFYRGAWALALAGQPKAAHAVLAWVRDNLLTSDGHLEGPGRHRITDWAYVDSNVIIGAQMLHQHDLSVALVPSLLRWQDPVSGGFANHRLPDGSASDDMDIPYAAGPGLALLMTGHVDEAARVVEFLDKIWDAQEASPGALPERFYCFWSRSRQRPILPSDPEFVERHVVDNTADRMQRWTIGGIAAAFLGRYYLVRPEPAVLDLARRYQAFSMAAIEAQFGYPSVCKTSWGASLLYQITGEAQYRDWLGRLARWYVDAQEPDGHWRPWVENTTGDVVQITLEYVVHLRTLQSAVASREPAAMLPARTAPSA